MSQITENQVTFGSDPAGFIEQTIKKFVATSPTASLCFSSSMPTLYFIAPIGIRFRCRLISDKSASVSLSHTRIMDLI